MSLSLSFVVAGIVCIVAAAAGAGVKAAGFEVEAIKSPGRQLLVAVLGVLLIGVGWPAGAEGLAKIATDIVSGVTRPDDAAPPTPALPADRDLELATPISSPACDSSWVVFVGAAVDPDTYATDVAALLNSFPGSDYLLTDGECSSLRQRLDDGRLIYSVYYGGFPTQADACAEQRRIGGDSYVKRLDDVTPADKLWEC